MPHFQKTAEWKTDSSFHCITVRSSEGWTRRNGKDVRCKGYEVIHEWGTDNTCSAGLEAGFLTRDQFNESLPIREQVNLF